MDLIPFDQVFQDRAQRGWLGGDELGRGGCRVAMRDQHQIIDRGQRGNLEHFGDPAGPIDVSHPSGAYAIIAADHRKPQKVLFMPYLSSNDCELFYQTGGTGTPVVFIHGGFAGLDTVLRDLKPDSWGWERDFAAHFHFVTYDRRGCYRSSSPVGGYALLNQIDDLAHVLDHLHITSAHLVGSSAGGPIAILFAATQPQRTRSLALVGTALDLFPSGEPGSETVRHYIDILENEGAEAAFDQRPPEVEVTLNEIWDHPEALASGKLDAYLARQQQWRSQAQHVPKAQRVHYYATELRNMQAYMQVDLRAFAQTVQVPAYVIHGQNDQMVPLVDAQKLAHVLPNARFEIINGGPHSLMHRDAHARQRVMEFMRAVDARI